MRLTMKMIKAVAAKKRSDLLDELIERDCTIFELAERHGKSAQAMGQQIKKARADRLK